jgi:restriction system protein
MSEPKAWLVRGGRAGERDQWALDSNVVGLGFHEVPDLSPCGDRDSIRSVTAASIPNLTDQAVTNYAAQLWAFKERIAIGDLAVLPVKNTPYVAVGRVTGPYRYDPSQPDPGRRHIRPVEWIRKDLPRTELGQDLLYSLGAFLTVCQVRRNDAAWRLGYVLQHGNDPGARSPEHVTPTRKQPVDDEEIGVLDDAADASGFDVIRYTKDRISARVRERFDGHRLSELVAAILTAEGFRCRVSPPGRDGGVDILAGTGPLGMDAPRLAVQVKSQPNAVSDVVLQQLHGAVTRNNADQGLLVAMGGVTKPAQDMLVGQHFKIAVWNSDDLIEGIFRHYSTLPEDMQADLSLQRTWVLIEDVR